jgi:hypothetical protein
MPIPLGVLAVAGAGAGPVAAGNAYEHLETVLLTGNQATIEFSNLNSTYGSTYQHLQIRWVGRTDRAATNDPLRYTFNGNSTNIYSDHTLFGNGTSVLANETNSSSPYTTMHQGLAGNTADANVFGAGILDILDPFETTKNKTARGLYAGMQSASAYQIRLHSAGFFSTSAITSITFDPIGNFVSGTRFSLYGMRSS